MAWPRPKYPGDFIAAKFYDIPQGEATVALDQGSTLVARLVVDEQTLVPETLYQLWFGPFSYASFKLQNVTQPNSTIQVAMFYLPEIGANRVLLGKPMELSVPNVGAPRGRQTVPMMHGFFAAENSNRCLFEVRATVSLGETNNNNLRIDNTLFGISAVAEPGAYRTVDTLP